MKLGLHEALIRDFPGLYTSLDWGFECGDGWEPLIRRLSAILEPLGAKATQVKEKFGTLRFYAAACTDAAHDAIDAAENESETTCEDCGLPGALRSDSWIRTLCDKDAAAWAARK